MISNTNEDNTKRLASVLQRTDKRTIQILAHYLSYQPEQLIKDIDSLMEYIRQAENINEQTTM